MQFNILPFLEKYFTKDEPVILACSCGPDSMFLLYKILETPYRKNLIACYFNHKLRTEADDEEKFLVKLGKKEGFKVEVGEWERGEESSVVLCHPDEGQDLLLAVFSESLIDINNQKNKGNVVKDAEINSAGQWKKGNLEEKARIARYRFFDEVLKKYSTNKVVLAHHLDDKIETFFFNLVRGSKLTGLINMTENSAGILRPLLDLQKKDIQKYLDENKLKYFVDKTNFDTNITRNKLRLEILPKFEKINGNYKENIANLMNYLEEVKENIDEEVEKFLEGNIAKDIENKKIRTFEISAFNSLSSFMQKEVIRYIYFISNNNSTIGLSEANIDEIIRFINGKNNKTIKEIGGLKMRKENKVILY